MLFSRRHLLFSALAGAVALPAVPLSVPQALAAIRFTLPTVSYRAERHVRGGGRWQQMRVYYAPGMERMELEGDAAAGNVIIVRYDRQVTWVVVPRMHAYIELPAEVSDRYLALMQGLTLTPLRRGRIGGAAATEYRVKGGLDGTMWLSRDGIPLKIEGETSIGGKPTQAEVEQTGITREAAPASLFEPPPGMARIALNSPSWAAMLQRFLPDR